MLKEFANSHDFWGGFILHVLPEDNDSSQFLLVYHKICNFITVKQFDYILLCTDMLKFICFVYLNGSEDMHGFV